MPTTVVFLYALMTFTTLSRAATISPTPAPSSSSDQVIFFYHFLSFYVSLTVLCCFLFSSLSMEPTHWRARHVSILTPARALWSVHLATTCMFLYKALNHSKSSSRITLDLTAHVIPWFFRTTTWMFLRWDCHSNLHHSLLRLQALLSLLESLLDHQDLVTCSTFQLRTAMHLRKELWHTPSSPCKSSSSPRSRWPCTWSSGSKKVSCYVIVSSVNNWLN